MTEKQFIGLSFGTLSSSIAIIGKNGNVETIANEDGDRNIPSYVAFTGYEELVGTQAKIQAISNPKGTIKQFRNLLGLSLDDEEVKHHIKDLPMTIVEHPESSVVSYEVDVYENEEAEESQAQYVTVSEVTSKYLKGLKETAEGYLGSSVNGVVVSVPSHFEERSQASLLEAAKAAGFEHVYPLSEPVAAALAFDSLKTSQYSSKADRTVAVVDLGGHQFNVTILSVNNGLYSILSSLDDYKLGGVHFDEVLVNFVKAEFKKKTKIDITGNRRSFAKLRHACELTKKMLSQKDTAPCSVDSLCEGMDYHAQILRGRFEMLAEPLFQRCGELVKNALTEAKLEASNVDEVLLVGGSSRIPRFQALIRSLFPASCSIRTDIEPDEAIGLGAAFHANMINKSSTDYSKVYVDPTFLKFPRVTKSLGVEVADGKIAVILPARTPLPASRTLHFSNSEIGQKEVFIAVYEGENEVAKKNRSVLDIVVSDLPADLKAGEAKIEVTFLIDIDNVFSVTAKEKTSGKTIKCKLSHK
ncbi:Cytoplasmic heat shock protein 70 [Phlyctochytrium planicorne]|nr:Cytoplasmic heat shock protein 70 [Phlyctochytrium planicorne]